MLIPSVKFFLGYFKQGSQPLPPTSTHSRPLPLIFRPLPSIFSFLAKSHSFSDHPYPLLNLSPLPPMTSLYHSFPVHFQMFSSNPTQHLPFQPIFSPYVLRSYVLQVIARLCVFVFHVPIRLCYSFLCTLLPRSRLFIQTVFFQKYILAVLFLLQYQSFFSICLFSYYLFIFFSAFISLMLQELKQSQDQKNRYFQNFIDFLKSLS